MATDGPGKVRNKKNQESTKPYDRPKSLLNRFGKTLREFFSLSRHKASLGLVHSTDPDRPEETVDAEGAAMQTNEHQASEDSGFNSRTTADGVVLECGGYQATFDPKYDLGYHTAPEMLPFARPLSSSTQSVGQSPPPPGFGFVRRPSPDSQAPTPRDPLRPSSAGFSFTRRSPDFQPSTSQDASLGTHSSDLGYAGKRPAPPPSRDDSCSEMSGGLQKNKTPFKRQCMESPSGPPPAVATPEIRDPVNRSRLTRKTSQTDCSFLWTTRLNSSHESSSAPLGHGETMTRKKPRFDVDIFDSTLRNPDASLLSSNHRQSPYYHGNTTYGGGASSRQKLFRHLDAQHKVVPTVHQKVQLNRTTPAAASGATVLSTTSRRMLEILEQYDSGRGPGMDSESAFRSGLTDSPLSFTPLTYRQNSLQVSGRSIPAKSGPPIRDLPIPPTLAIIRNNVRAFQNPNRKDTIKKTEMTSNSGTAKPLTNTTASYNQSTDQSSAAPGKMRREPTRRHYIATSTGEDQEEMEPDVELSLIKFPATNMKPLVTIMSSSSTASSGSTISGARFASEETFTFSSPISLCSNGAITTNSEPKSFKFRSPIAIDDGVTSSTASAPMETELTTSSSKSSLAMSFNLNAAVKKPDQLSSSSSNAGSVGSVGFGGFAPAVELKHGSIMDFLGTSKNPPPKTTGTSPPKSTSVDPQMVTSTESGSDNRPLSELFRSSNKWSCPQCFVDNGNNESKCVCCDAGRPQARPTTSVSASSPPPPPPPATFAKPLSEMFKAAANSWSCPQCFVSNAATASECPCCNAKKPVGTSSSSSVAKVTGTKADEAKALETEKHIEVLSASVNLPSLASQFKKPPGEWSCPGCFVSNKAESLKCCACEDPKPGAAQKSDNPNSNNNSSSGSSATMSTTSADHAIATDGFKVGAGFGNGSRSAFGVSAADASSVAVAPSAGGFKVNVPAGGFSGFTFGSSSQLTTKDDSSSTSGGFKPTSGFVTKKTGSSNGDNEKPKAVSFAMTTVTSSSSSSEKPSAVATSGASEDSLGNGGFGFKANTEFGSRANSTSSGFAFNSSNFGGFPSSDDASLAPQSGFQFKGSEARSATAASQQPSHHGAEKHHESKTNTEVVTSDAMVKLGTNKPSAVFGTSGFDGLKSGAAAAAAAAAPSFGFSGSGSAFGSANSAQPKFEFAGRPPPQVDFSGVLPAATTSSLPASTSSSQTFPSSSGSVAPATQTGIFGQTSAAFDKAAAEPKKQNLFTFGQNASSAGTDVRAAPTLKTGQSTSSACDGPAASTFAFGQNQPSQEVKSSASNSNLFVFGQQQPQQQQLNPTSSNSVFQFGAGFSSTTPNAGPFGSTNNRSVSAPAFGQQGAISAPPQSFNFVAPKFTFGAAPSEAKPARANLSNMSVLQGTKRPLADDDSTAKRGRVSSEEMQMQDEPTSGSFSFGSVQQQQSFVFGGQQPTTVGSVFFGQRPMNPVSAFQGPPGVPAPSFSFTGLQASAPPSFGAQNAANVANGAVSTGAGFGAGAAAPQGFSFNSTPSFNFAGTSSNQSGSVTFKAQPNAAPIAGRVFKRAVRRTPNKH